MLHHYLRTTIRNLRIHPSTSFINIFGLTVGITCCMLILLYIRNELSYDRFHERADSIYRVVHGNSARTPTALGPALKEQFPEIEAYARIRGAVNVWMMAYEDKAFYEHDVYRVGKDFFKIFTFPLIQGNPETVLDDYAYPEPTVVISESTAEKLFGDENPMNKLIRADGQFDLRVTGIMKDVPSNAHFPADYFVCEELNVENRQENYTRSWRGTSHFTYILLTEGTDPAELENKISGWLESHEPLQFYKDQGTTFEFRLQPLTDIHLRSDLERDLVGNSDIRYIYVFSAVAFFILLIACINFMNLTTARSITRAKEVGIRKAIGALRVQLMTQFLGESMLSAGVAFVLALGLLVAVLPWFNGLVGKTLQLSYLDDPEVLIWLAGITLFVGLLSGSYPALFISGFHPVKILKGDITGSAKRTMLRKSLVVAQFTLSILLIISTAVVYRQLEFMKNKQLGFDKDQIVIIPLIGAVDRAFDTFKTQLSQNPHIQGVTRSVMMPGRMSSAAWLPVFPMRPAGQPEENMVEIPTLFVSHDFEETMGLRLLAGRTMSGVPASDSIRAVIMNQSAIARFGITAPEDIVGRRLRLGSLNIEIAGVVEDFYMRSFHNSLEPIQLMFTSRAGQAAIRLQAQNIPDGIKALEETWAAEFPDYPLAYSFLNEDFERLYVSEQRTGDLFGAFSFIAILIACLGLFGLAAFTTRLRTKEVGIHKVMGASVSHVVFLLSKDFLKPVLIAVPLAWALAYWAMSNWLQNFIHRIDMSVWWFLIAGILALVIALITVGMKAVKAALVNPVETLRYE